MGKLKVNIDELVDEITDLENALDDFKDSFDSFSDNVSILEENETERFIPKFVNQIIEINNSIENDHLENINVSIEVLNSIVTNLEQIDNDLASGVNSDEV